MADDYADLAELGIEGFDRVTDWYHDWAWDHGANTWKKTNFRRGKKGGQDRNGSPDREDASRHGDPRDSEDPSTVNDGPPGKNSRSRSLGGEKRDRQMERRNRDSAYGDGAGSNWDPFEDERRRDREREAYEARLRGDRPCKYYPTSEDPSPDYERDRRSSHYPPSSSYSPSGRSERRDRRSSRRDDASSSTALGRAKSTRERDRNRDREREREHRQGTESTKFAAHVVGAIAGGLAGNELTKSDLFGTLAAAAVGAWGAGKVEKQWEKRQAEQEGGRDARSRSRPPREKDSGRGRQDGGGGYDSDDEEGRRRERRRRRSSP